MATDSERIIQITGALLPLTSTIISIKSALNLMLIAHKYPNADNQKLHHEIEQVLKEADERLQKAIDALEPLVRS